MATITQAGYMVEKNNKGHELAFWLEELPGVGRVWISCFDERGRHIPNKISVELIDLDPFNFPALVKDQSSSGVILTPCF